MVWMFGCVGKLNELDMMTEQKTIWEAGEVKYVSAPLIVHMACEEGELTHSGLQL